MPDFVLLAAGCGSRYGAPKQFEPVGRGGATIIDYSIHDAIRAGFARIVLVVRRELEPAFRNTIGRRWHAHIPLLYVSQDEDPTLVSIARLSGRTKPWGTAHAVLSAAAVLDTRFAVGNADDLYGGGTLAALGAWLRDVETAAPPTYAVVTFPLAATLADSGGVNRAICDVSPEGWVGGIREVVAIERADGDGRYPDGRGGWQPIAGTRPVSMNLWGLTPAIFPQLAARFRTFLDAHGDNHAAEFLLPGVVGDLIAGAEARVRAIPSAGRWQGLTYRSDLVAVRAHIAGLTASGKYPPELASSADGIEPGAPNAPESRRG